MAPRRTCRRPSRSRVADAAQHADAAHFQEGESGRPADLCTWRHSATLPLSAVDEYAETLMAQRISTVSGVAQVQVWARRNTPCAFSSIPTRWPRTVSASTKCRPRMSQHNVNLPTGTLNGSQQAFTVQATGQLMSAAAYRPLIVAYRNGSPVRLGELGRVIDSVQNDKAASWFNTTRHRSGRAAAARHQHRCSGGRRQGLAAFNSAR
jgi:multidrug efflux pump subunit AcrB